MRAIVPSVLYVCGLMFVCSSDPSVDCEILLVFSCSSSCGLVLFVHVSVCVSVGAIHDNVPVEKGDERMTPALLRWLSYRCVLLIPPDVSFRPDATRVGLCA